MWITVIIFIWLVWWLSWFWIQETDYNKITAAGNLFVLIGIIFRSEPYLVVGPMVGVLIGLSLAWWGRYHLGDAWSPGVTPVGKRVTTGPYRWLKHPIYTGYCLALVSTAVGSGSFIAVGGSLIAIVGFHIKIKVEEALLDRSEGISHHQQGFPR